MQTATTPKIFSSSFRGFLNGFFPTVLVHFPSPFPPILDIGMRDRCMCVSKWRALATKEEGGSGARMEESGIGANGLLHRYVVVRGGRQRHTYGNRSCCCCCYCILDVGGLGQTNLDNVMILCQQRCVRRGRGRISRNRLPSLPSRPLCPAEWTGIFSPGDEMR